MWNWLQEQDWKSVVSGTISTAFGAFVCYLFAQAYFYVKNHWKWTLIMAYPLCFSIALLVGWATNALIGCALVVFVNTTFLFIWNKEWIEINDKLNDDKRKKEENNKLNMLMWKFSEGYCIPRPDNGYDEIWFKIVGCDGDTFDASKFNSYWLELTCPDCHFTMQCNDSRTFHCNRCNKTRKVNCDLDAQRERARSQFYVDYEWVRKNPEDARKEIEKREAAKAKPLPVDSTASKP